MLFIPLDSIIMTWNKFWFLLFIKIAIVNVRSASAANILNLMGCPSPSHHIWNSVLVNALAARGHNVTVLSTNQDPNPPKNVHYILLEGVYDYMYKEQKVDLISMAYITPIEAVDILYGFSIAACNGIRRAKGPQTLLDYPNEFKFDLVLYDYTLGPCILGYLHKFNYPPLISYTAYNNPPHTTSIIGGHNYFSYMPHFAAMYDSKMSFWERGVNLYMHLVDFYQREYVLLPLLDEISAEIFGPEYPRARDLEYRTQLVLVNTHPAVDFPEPLPPNVIPVGGLQIQEPKPLSKEIDKFLREGINGSVLFSLGTNIHSKNLAIEKQRAIVAAFSQLPEYNFLWKFEEAKFPFKLPSNVMIKQWLSQNDVLNHSNVKGFVTHGGALSTYEATWHGVPTVGIPFIVDQYRNIHKSVQLGVSEHVNYPTLTTGELKEKLTKILTEPSYAAKMAIRSKRLRDQPEKPIDRAIWWIEYVLRNGNLSHLQSPVVEMGFIRGNNLDLYAIGLIGILSMFIVVIIVVRHILFLVLNSREKIKLN